MECYAFELKILLLNFSIMNDIFYPYSDFSIVYIDDTLIYSINIDQHFKHLRILKDVVKRYNLVLSAPKIKLFKQLQDF